MIIVVIRHCYVLLLIFFFPHVAIHFCCALLLLYMVLASLCRAWTTPSPVDPLQRTQILPSLLAKSCNGFYFFLIFKKWARSFSPGRSFFGLSRQIWNQGLFFPKLWSKWVGDLPKEDFSQIWWEVQEVSRISWACAFLPMKWWSPAAQITLTRSHKSQVTHIFL
jgi:hypothetical protein